MYDRFKRRSPQVFVLCTLAISIMFNILTILRLKLKSVDDSQYSMSLSSSLSSDSLIVLMQLILTTIIQPNYPSILTRLH